MGGLAEATVFIIVPEVWLSGVAVLGLRRGLIACLYALAWIVFYAVYFTHMPG